MGWFAEFLESGFGGFAGTSFEWLRAVGSLLGVFMVVGGLIILAINLFLGNSKIKANISVKPIFWGLILILVCGSTFGLHYFDIL